MGSLLLASCGSYNNSSTNSSTAVKHPSGLTFRAFVSNPLNGTTAGATSPALNIVNASTDVLSTSAVNLSSAGSNAGMMVLSPDRSFTVVSMASDNSLVVVDNNQERIKANSSGNAALPAISLPGTTQSFLVWKDNATAFAAVPTAPVNPAQGPAPGGVVAIDIATSTIFATIPASGAQYIVESHAGNDILVFGSQAQTVTLISPALIGTSTDPRTAITSASFDHPVWGIFTNDDTTAYIMNCGAECGGNTTSVAVLDMTQNPPQVTSTISVPAATYGFLNGATLYVAGTSPSDNSCAGTNTTATRCGRLSVISISSNSVTNPNEIAISDGYHNRIELTMNGELFIGARTCNGGCLSIVNAATVSSGSAVVIPAATGDVTGIQPITGRNVVYVCQNGALNIYDSLKNALQTTQVDIVGQAVDVKLVDSP